MDFELSEDQLALADAAREMLSSLASTARVRAVVDAGGGYDVELWHAMRDQGWMALELTEKEGGLGMGLVELAVLCEQVGRHVAPAPFLTSVLALAALRDAEQGEAERESSRLLEWSSELAVGEAVGCVSCGELRAGRVGGGVRAEESGGSWTLSGLPPPVVYAPVADVVILAATADTGPALFATGLDGRNRPGSQSAMDRTRCLGWLELDRAPAVRLGGAEAVERLVDRAAAATSAELLGAASRVLEMSVSYAKDRVQFGRPIGSFQAVKHRCADMLVDVEGMWSTAYNAAWTVGAGHTDSSLAASTAKAWCSDAARRVMASGLQVHGGIGFTWEHDLHLYLKRSQLDQVSFGDATFHRERLAGLLRQRVAEGRSVF